MSSASRPHLLRQILSNIFRFVDQPPDRVFVHEDIQGPEWRGAVRDVVYDPTSPWSRVRREYLRDEPPILHGPTIHRLVMASAAEIVMYAQDDDAPIRPIPVKVASAVMQRHALTQIRFNKRVTMAAHRGWPKREVDLDYAEQDGERGPLQCTPLVLAEKFHFTFSLWNRAYVAAVANWWETTHPGSIREHGEAKLGAAMAGAIPEFSATGLVKVPEPGTHLRHEVRMDTCKTFIWGRIGDPPFTEHLGWRKEDWRLPRTNRSGNEYRMRMALLEQGGGRECGMMRFEDGSEIIVHHEGQRTGSA